MIAASFYYCKPFPHNLIDYSVVKDIRRLIASITQQVRLICCQRSHRFRLRETASVTRIVLWNVPFSLLEPRGEDVSIWILGLGSTHAAKIAWRWVASVHHGWLRVASIRALFGAQFRLQIPNRPHPTGELGILGLFKRISREWIVRLCRLLVSE